MAREPVDLTRIQNVPSTPAPECNQPGITTDPAEGPARPWPVTAVGFLLMLQAVGLFGIGLFYVLTVDSLVILARILEMTAGELISAATHNSLVGMVYLPLSILGVVAAVGMWRLWPAAWLNAMLVQGLSLAVALMLYVGPRPAYVYAVMIYSTMVVIYLYHADIRITFHTEDPVEE
jgi:hypothetical protein